jgi:hypothetical protein
VITSGEGLVGYHRELVDLLRELHGRRDGPSLRRIAVDAAVSIGHLSGIFNGRKCPGPQVAVAVAVALGATAGEVVRARRYAEGAAANKAATRVGRPAFLIGTDVVPHPAYLQQVRRIALGELLGREAELTELARFCTVSDGGSYAWWRAPAWAGKSALLSSFVLDPPAGVRVVSFFITARLAGQDS